MAELSEDHEAETLVEAKEAEQRRSPGGRVVYDAVMLEAEEELDRTSSALFWSALAAGLSMGASMIAEAVLRHALPESNWRPMVAKLGYAFGFFIVILGRQQLFTENTLTPMLPLMRHKDWETFREVMRLWVVVFIGNMIGAVAVAGVCAKTNAFDPQIREQFSTLGAEAMRHGFGTIVLRAVFAGWLIALLVWMLPYAESAHFWVILAITWLIGVGQFSHVVAGAVEVFSTAWAGDKSWWEVTGGFIAPALIGNIIGGVTLVAALNHAQVVAGK